MSTTEQQCTEQDLAKTTLGAISGLAATEITNAEFEARITEAQEHMLTNQKLFDGVSRKTIEHINNPLNSATHETVKQSLANWQSQLQETISKYAGELDNIERAKKTINAIGKNAGMFGDAWDAFNFADAFASNDPKAIGDSLLSLLTGAAAVAIGVAFTSTIAGMKFRGHNT